MRWARSWRADPVVRAIADRHYARQVNGNVGAQQFVAPGRCLVLRTVAGDAGWVTSWPMPEHAKHGYGDAWICTLFRNESDHLSSELIGEAVAATRYVHGPPPPAGFLTFVDERRIRRKRDPGRCFRRAGFVPVGRTSERDLLVLWLPRESVPAPAAPLELQLTIEAA